MNRGPMTTADGEALSSRRTYRIEWAVPKPLVPLATNLPSRAEAQTTLTKLAKMLDVNPADLIVVGNFPEAPHG